MLDGPVRAVGSKGVNRLNVIVIMLDSLRQDHVSAYGWPECPLKTTHLDAFAAEAVVFDNCYPEGLPTIPVRTDLMTGLSSLTNRTWQPLVPTDMTLTQILRRTGYLTAMVADTYHYFGWDMNFHRQCEVFHWIRGAEYDGTKAGPLRRLKLQDHITDRMPKEWLRLVESALRNLEDRREPEDFPCWQTVDRAIQVMDGARRDGRPLYLWIDTFQTHEPWCPPARFDTFGDPAYRGPKIVLPPGGPANAWGTPDQIARIRSLYAGEVAYVDHCVGRLLKGMREMGYLDDSILVALADHGHPLSDHGKFLKGPDRLYNELLKVPFMVRLPKGERGGRRVTDLATFPDLAPTLLDLTGLGANARCMSGHSLRPIIEGTGRSAYPVTISGFFGSTDRCIRNERYSYILRPAGQKDELYDLASDPKEQNNLIDEQRDVAEALFHQVGVVYLGHETTRRGVQGSFEVSRTALA